MNEQNQRDSIMSMARGAFEERVDIDGQTYADASLTRIPPHVDRPDSISVSGLV